MVIYLFAVYRFAKKEITLLQIISFVGGYVLLVFSVASPFAVISHVSFSLHMVQMSILYFFIPPLLMLGIPEKLFHLPLNIRIPSWLKKAHFPSNVALYTFAVLFFLYHTPVILTFLFGNPVIKSIYLFLLFGLSFSMWKPIASPDPLLRLCTCKVKRYTFISAIVITPACLLFIGSAFLENTSNPFLSQLAVHLCSPNLSETFQSVLPWPFNSKYDQVLSGILMMVLHKFSLAIAIRLERKVSERFYEELEGCEHIKYEKEAYQ
jgi:putative membrane protein